MKKAEEAARKAYPNYWKCYPFETNKEARAAFIKGYEQAEKDLADAAAFSSGPDGFYYGKGYQQGKKDAEKHLGWHSVEECLPPVDEEVIVLADRLDLGSLYAIAVGHIVDKEKAVDYDGWNIPGVKFWMPMPKIPNEK